MNAERLTRLLEPVVSQVGLELDRVDVVPAGRRRLVRVTIDGDGPDGHGPSLDEISEATAEISHCLDDSGAMGESPYTLEVSSRGVSTPPYPAAPLSTQHRAPGAVHPQSGRGAEIWRDL